MIWSFADRGDVCLKESAASECLGAEFATALAGATVPLYDLNCGSDTLVADIRTQDQPLLLKAGLSDNRFRVVGATAVCSARWELTSIKLESLDNGYLGPNNLRPELESEIIFNEVRCGHDRVISRRETGFGC